MLSPPLVTILLPDLRGGGAERVNVNLANEFISRGLAVDVVLMCAAGEMMPLLDPRVSVIDLGVKRMRNVLRPLVRYLRQSRPSSILANMWPLTSIAVVARLLSRIGGRLVLVEHVTLSRSEVVASPFHYWLLRKSMRMFANSADAIVTVSGGVADDLSAITGIRRDSFSAIHNPIVKAVRGPIQPPSTCPRGSKPLIVNVGTLKAQKDQATLLRAFRILKRQVDARLLILGEGELRRELQELALNLGVSEDVSMPGFTSDPTEIYRSASLFVLSSAWEGFGNVIVEALEQGTPVVSTDCPSGPREILDNGRYGALVPVADPEALAHAMFEALNRTHDAAALRARAAEFGVGKAADAYLDLLLPDWRRQQSYWSRLLPLHGAQ